MKKDRKKDTGAPATSRPLLPWVAAMVVGTAQMDISSEDIINGLGLVAFFAQAPKDRGDLLARLETDAKPGDCIPLMGARDPSLPALVQRIVEQCGGKAKSWQRRFNPQEGT